MTFLEIYQRAYEKCAVSATLPTATTSQTGEALRVLHYVNEAWMDIQRLHFNWNFMWNRKTDAQMILGVATYDPSFLTLNYVNEKSFTAYDEDLGESEEFRLTFIPYMKFRREYDVGTHDNDQPSKVTMRPDKVFQFYPTPDDDYVFQFDYYKEPTELSGDSDTPEMPDQFHMLVVHGAVMKYAEYEEAADVYAGASVNYNILLSRLRREELPMIDARIRAMA